MTGGRQVFMKVYKRTKWKLVKSLMIVPLPPVAVGIVLLWALQWFPYIWFFAITVGLPIIIFFCMLYGAIWGTNIRFEIDNEGKCNYYQNNKLKKSYNLKDCDTGYHHVKDANGGTERLSLRITSENGQTDILDCEPIGEKQFRQMFEEMQNFSEVEIEKL